MESFFLIWPTKLVPPIPNTLNGLKGPATRYVVLNIMSATFCPNLCVLRNFQKGMTYTHNQIYINGIILNRFIISKFKYQ